MPLAKITFFLAVLLSIGWGPTPRHDGATLAAQTAAKCIATANDPITPAMMEQKVMQACELLSKEGLAALPKFKGTHSDFIFCGTYLVVRSGEGIQVMHPIKYTNEGKYMLDRADIKGKKFYLFEHDLIIRRGSGWFDYWWPKPGEKTPSHKVSYAHAVMIEGKLYIVAGGIYDMPEEQIKKLVSPYL